VVVWSGGGIFGRRFDAAGVAQGDDFQVSTDPGGTQGRPAVSMDAAGNFVVAWQNQGQDGSSAGVFGRRFDASGAPLGPEFQVNTFTTGYQWRPAVSAAPGGGFVVAWEGAEQDGSATGVFAQRFDAAGSPLGAELQVNTYTFLDQRDPKVAHGPGGGFVVVWDRVGAIGLGVFGRRFDAAGAPQGLEFQVTPPAVTDQYGADISGDPSRGYVVAWTGMGIAGDLSGRGVFARRLDAAGIPSGAGFVVNAFTTSDQAAPSVATAPGGGLVAAWESAGQDGSGAGIFGSVECARLYAIPPCRLADTREPPGTPLAAGATLTVPAAGRCGIPADARAVAVNVTVVSPTAAGNLRVYPSGVAVPLASFMNFAAGRTRANSGLAALGADGRLAVRGDMPAGGSTHLVVDVFGYFKR
jgi:hypothetical protein